MKFLRKIAGTVTAMDVTNFIVLLWAAIIMDFFWNTFKFSDYLVHSVATRSVWVIFTTTTIIIAVIGFIQSARDDLIYQILADIMILSWWCGLSVITIYFGAGLFRGAVLFLSIAIGTSVRTARLISKHVRQKLL